jgi:hypothetical protein
MRKWEQDVFKVITRSLDDSFASLGTGCAISKRKLYMQMGPVPIISNMN